MAKQNRIDFRVEEDIKTQFTEAAEVFGMNLSTFMIAAAQEQVARAQRHKQAVMLNDRDRDLFLAALDRPARPMPESIRKAKARHAALVVGD
ncbi:DUF1778 domain-containing protein [Sedimenticola hydrogenitrophicus]|uniref:type II toxin-antitoxin system TacA family antitoxin n=1 Tax=Sedimenticola hydrogenitrophicus TaxID=2967975 RepID=UPI0023AFB67C|nr:DUF1778 domain-containing protein [Sedimenticola hydrogenitrophicus]